MTGTVTFRQRTRVSVARREFVVSAEAECQYASPDSPRAWWFGVKMLGSGNMTFGISECSREQCDAFMSSIFDEDSDVIWVEHEAPYPASDQEPSAASIWTRTPDKERIRG